MFSVALPQPVEGLDPHRIVSSVSRSVLRGCFETLVDRERGFRPCLAESWEPIEDGWRFHLRRDVAFHDGTPFDAEAVLRALERFHDPSLGNILGATLAAVSETVASGPYTVDFRTGAPSVLIPLALGRVPIALSPDGDLDATPVGTGAFRPVDHSAGGAVTLERFDSYWGAPAVPERVVWSSVGDGRARIEAVASGKADLATAIEPHLQASSPAGVELIRRPNMLSTSVMLNLKRPFLASTEVRRAINLAVDVDALIEDVLDGAGRPLAGPAGPELLGADPGTAPYPYDPDRARALIDAAGAAGERLEIAYPDDRYATAARACASVARFLCAVGLDAVAVPMAWEPFVAGIGGKTHDAFYLQISTMAAERLLPNEFSSRVQGVGWQSYVNHEVDEVLARMVVSLDDAARRELLVQAASLLRDDPPWLFLYNEDDIYAAAPGASGWEARPNGFVDVTRARRAAQ